MTNETNETNETEDEIEPFQLEKARALGELSEDYALRGNPLIQKFRELIAKMNLKELELSIKLLDNEIKLEVDSRVYHQRYNHDFQDDVICDIQRNK